MLVMGFLLAWDQGKQHFYMRVGIFAVFSAILATRAYMMLNVKYPRCGFDMRSKRKTVTWAEVAKVRCPHCGVGLDELKTLG
jgi:hypothetical protein